MQVLTLLTQLRTAILQLQATLKKCSAPATVTTSSGLHDTPSSLASNSTTATLDAVEQHDAAVALQACDSLVSEAIRSLDTLAQDAILSPYLSAAAYALESIIARMHLENFGNVGTSGTSDSYARSNPGSPAGALKKQIPASSTDSSSGQGVSAYMLELQSAVTGLYAEHLKPISTLSAPYAAESLRRLADRLVRSFVSHAALVRPLQEQGKLKVSRTQLNI